jgi:hypothetical protein
LLCTLEPMLDVSGDASRGAVADTAAVPDDDKLSGSVLRHGDLHKQPISTVSTRDRCYDFKNIFAE